MHWSKLYERFIAIKMIKMQLLFYLYVLDMVHRDLKLENILLAKNPEDNSDDLCIKVSYWF